MTAKDSRSQSGKHLDLLVAAQEQVGHLMKALGIFDPDIPKERAGAVAVLDDDGGWRTTRWTTTMRAATRWRGPSTTSLPTRPVAHRPPVRPLSDTPYDSLRNLTVADAVRELAGLGSLSLVEATRMCWPEDARGPLSLSEAEKLAS